MGLRDRPQPKQTGRLPQAQTEQLSGLMRQLRKFPWLVADGRLIEDTRIPSGSTVTLKHHLGRIPKVLPMAPQDASGLYVDSANTTAEDIVLGNDNPSTALVVTVWLY